VGVVEKTVTHRGVTGKDMYRHSRLSETVAVAGNGDDAVNKISFSLGYRERIPSKLIRCCGEFVKGRRSEIAAFDLAKGFVQNRRANPIGPRPFVSVARNGERGARKLFGVESERRLLRGVLPNGQSARNGLGRKLVSKSGLVS